MAGGEGRDQDALREEAFEGCQEDFRATKRFPSNVRYVISISLMHPAESIPVPFPERPIWRATLANPK
jgi:hypothetical protein